MHPSVIEAGSRLQSTASNLLFSCPLCPKLKTSRVKTAQRHLDTHITNAVHFQDKIICRCNLSCRYTGHYHCPYCAKTIMRREDMTIHVTACQNTSHPVPRPSVPHPLVPCLSVPRPSVPPSVPRPSPLSTPCVSKKISTPASTLKTLPEPPSEPRSPLAVLEGCNASAVTVDHTYTLRPSASHRSAAGPPASCEPPPAPPAEASAPQAFSPEAAVSTAAVTADATEVPSSRVKYLKSVTCPHCSLYLYKKNLAVHIQRKHSRSKGVTAAPHIKNECVDESIQNTGQRPSDSV